MLGKLFAQLVSKIFNLVVMIHQRHRQTVRRTDNVRSQDRDLHYSASRGKKIKRAVSHEILSS